jgi:hypothetical protein
LKIFVVGMKSSSLLRSHPRDIVVPARITYILSAKLDNGIHKGDIISPVATDAKNATKNFLPLLITIAYLFIEKEEGTIKYYEMKKIDARIYTILRFK